MREPTGEECNTNASAVIDGRTYRAAWYPQMGGSVGKCWIDLHDCDDRDDDRCFGVYVYHDGEFPFGNDAEPASLHHCAPSQFINFGNLVLGMQRGER